MAAKETKKHKLMADKESYIFLWQRANKYKPVREAVSYRGLFTAGWFGVRKKHCSRLEIYDRLRASEQAVCPFLGLWVDLESIYLESNARGPLNVLCSRLVP